MPTCIQEISPGMGSRPNIFQGVPTLFFFFFFFFFFLGGGGGSIAISIQTCGFSRVGVPLDLRTTYIHVSLLKAFKM